MFTNQNESTSFSYIFVKTSLTLSFENVHAVARIELFQENNYTKRK